ncbi:MAG: ArsB/NhaD family transporter [Firmicutes bacterium]|nr:ArsB/NhaD family transporter [Bacillota bacterium]
MSASEWLVLASLVALYALLLGDWFHRAWVALGLAALLVVTGTMSPEAAFRSIDWNTLGLLAGMMVFVSFLKDGGLFEWLGAQALRWSRGHPWRLLGVFYGVTGLVSSVLDNVTTILLLSPVLIQAAEELDVDPVPLVMAAVVASNLGGVATLIGDPPNILIGTAAGLSFAEFLKLLGPVALIMLGLVYWALPWLLGREIKGGAPKTVVPRDRPAVSPRLPWLLAILALMLIGFLMQHVLHVAVAWVAIGGALLAWPWAEHPWRGWMRRIDWGTLGFFAGVFVLVGALEATGLIGRVVAVLTSPGLGLWLPVVLFLGTGIFSALLDNVPLVAALIPALAELHTRNPLFGVELWVAVGLGAAVGGNATVIGASANVVAQGLLFERGYRLSFGRYARFGTQVALLTALIGVAYVGLRF